MGEGKGDVAADKKKAETGEAEPEEKGEDKPGAVKEDGAAKEDVKGIPNFWLTAMSNAEALETMVKVR